MKKILISIFSLWSLSSCEDLYTDVSTASEQQATSDQIALIALVNGLQSKFTTTRAGALYNLITVDGLVTKSQKVLNAGNTEELQFETGGASLLNANANLNNFWNQCHLVKSNADMVIRNINNAAEPAVRSGILSSAHLYRGLALGTLASFWEKAPIEVKENASFATRSQLLEEAVKSLQAGAAAYTAQTPSSAFTAEVSTAVNIPNSLQALIARYSLMLGKYDEAIAAADKVNLKVTSGFAFNDIVQNPIFFVSFGNTNVTEPLQNFGLTGTLIPNSADGRIPFYYNQTPAPPTGSRFNLGRASFFTSNASVIPIYLPGEMLLIKAEAQARKGAIAAAIVELDKVLTKTDDVWGINAKLAKYSGASTAEAVLTEIYKQRQIELMYSGQRLEDSRRFNRPQSERTRSWLPYPLFERNNNSSIPADPTF